MKIDLPQFNALFPHLYSDADLRERLEAARKVYEAARTEIICIEAELNRRSSEALNKLMNQGIKDEKTSIRKQSHS